MVGKLGEANVLTRITKSLLLLLVGSLIGCSYLVAQTSGTQAAPGSGRVRVLVITGGHKYEVEPFRESFRAMKSISFTQVDHGAEMAKMLKPEAADSYDAMVFYDVTPHCDAYIGDLERLFEQGKGVVFLHHAISSCTDNSEYAYMVGGVGIFVKPLGTNITTANFKKDNPYRAHIVDANNPITAGMKDFDVTDETYTNFFVNTDVKVFLTADHADASHQLAWTWQYKKSPVVYLELGHDHTTYENPNYRTVLERSILWVSGRLTQ
jgi:type 1 glutamine amidotransferase